MEMFYILFVLVVMQLCKFAKTQGIVHLNGLILLYASHTSIKKGFLKILETLGSTSHLFTDIPDDSGQNTECMI